MIKTFKHKGLKLYYEKGKTTGIQSNHSKKLRMQLAAIDTANEIEDINMHNPPHPGEFIQTVYLEPHGVSCRTLASHLGVAASTLSRVVKGKSAVSPEMALRLSKVLGRTPESWMSLQDNYELWQAKQNVDLKNVHPLDLNVA